MTRVTRASGFTLIELMVVLIVVGIVLTTALLYIRSPGPDELRHQAASGLWAVSRAARDEAILRHQVLGLRFERDNYQIQVRQNGTWSTPPEQGLYRLRTLPSGMELQLVSSAWIDQLDKDQSDTPQVLFLPNGEISAFEVAVRDLEGSHYELIHTDEYNEIRLK